MKTVEQYLSDELGQKSFQIAYLKVQLESLQEKLKEFETARAQAKPLKEV